MAIQIHHNADNPAAILLQLVTGRATDMQTLYDALGIPESKFPEKSAAYDIVAGLIEVGLLRADGPMTRRLDHP
jgi:hypothetical protein